MKNLDKQKIIENLKQKCSAFINFYTEKNNNIKLNIYKSIEAILNSENVFDKIDATVALNLINDLVNDKLKAKEIYLSLISE